MLLIMLYGLTIKKINFPSMLNYLKYDEAAQSRREKPSNDIFELFGLFIKGIFQ